MKKIILLLFLASSLSFAQFFPPNTNEGVASGGLGMSWIDGQPNYTFRFNPELAFSNIGIGLDLLLEFDSSGKIRTENFKQFSDYLRIIRYIRYGVKNDPVYVRVGALDYATLGYGNIIYLYNNNTSFDRRTIGMEMGVDFNTFGFEFVYSNFMQAGVTGLRGYVRPFQLTSMSSFPLIGKMEIGATYATDFDKNAGVMNGAADSDGNFLATDDIGKMAAYGFDLGLPVISNKLIDMKLFYNYTQIVDFGSGSAGGVMFDFKGFGLLDLKIKMERRWNTDQYLPSYFNALYEVDRFNIDENGSVSSKAALLRAATNVSNGWYGGLYARVLGMFDVMGSYQRLDRDPTSGLLHISSDVAPENAPFIARLGYDKRNIKDEVDLFKLDDRSHAFFELGYKPMPYVVVSLIYHWTFSPIRDAGDNVIGFEPQKRIEPSVRFVYPFNM